MVWLPSAFKWVVSIAPKNAYRIPKPSDMTESISLTLRIPSASKRQHSFKIAYWMRLSAKPSIWRDSTTGFCPASAILVEEFTNELTNRGEGTSQEKLTRHALLLKFPVWSMAMERSQPKERSKADWLDATLTLGSDASCFQRTAMAWTLKWTKIR